MMLENCHNAPSWWSPQADAATVCDSNMWRSGGDIGNGFGGAHSEAHQWFGKNNLSAAHPCERARVGIHIRSCDLISRIGIRISSVI